MVPELRKKYNYEFNNSKYEAFIDDLSNVYPGQLDFRSAETPVFIPKDFANKIFSACESIIDVITRPEYQQQSEKSIPQHLRVLNEDSHPHCIAFDFGVCTNEKGGLEPQLIEMQGFPSLFAWQVMMMDVYSRNLPVPKGYSPYLGKLDRASYIDLLKKMILGKEDPENVILLE